MTLRRLPLNADGKIEPAIDLMTEQMARAIPKTEHEAAEQHRRLQAATLQQWYAEYAAAVAAGEDPALTERERAIVVALGGLAAVTEAKAILRENQQQP